MPELDFAILCQAARVAPDNLMYVLAGGWDTLAGPEGVVQPVTVALRILFTQGECGRPHRVEAIVQDADGRRLAVVTAVVTPQLPQPGTSAGRTFNAMTVLPIPVFFPHHGDYGVELLVNDTSLKSIPLRYVAGPPLPVVPPAPSPPSAPSNT